MGNNSLLILALGILVLAGACSKQEAESPLKQHAESVATVNSENAAFDYVSILKNRKLANYQSATIGDAFDSYKYLSAKEWNERTAADGSIYIDFIGWFDQKSADKGTSTTDVAKQGIAVMFVIDPKGAYYVFMVSKVDAMADGKILAYRIDDSAGVLSAIYANRPIKLDN